MVDRFQGVRSGADSELVEAFTEMADRWYVAVRARDEENVLSSLAPYTFTLWSTLERRLYRIAPTGSFDFARSMAIERLMTTLSGWTQPYFLALVNGKPMPSVAPGPHWFMERFQAFRPS